MNDFYIDLSTYGKKERIILSAAIQRHAFNIGINWAQSGKKVIPTDEVIVISNNKMFTISGKRVVCHKLSVENFLNMKKSDLEEENKINFVCADFSWLHGEVKKILVRELLHRLNIDVTDYKHVFKMGWISISEDRKIISGYNEKCINAKEITVNDMLTGNY